MNSLIINNLVMSIDGGEINNKSIKIENPVANNSVAESVNLKIDARKKLIELAKLMKKR